MGIPQALTYLDNILYHRGCGKSDGGQDNQCDDVLFVVVVNAYERSSIHWLFGGVPCRARAHVPNRDPGPSHGQGSRQIY